MKPQASFLFIKTVLRKAAFVVCLAMLASCAGMSPAYPYGYGTNQQWQNTYGQPPSYAASHRHAAVQQPAYQQAPPQRQSVAYHQASSSPGRSGIVTSGSGRRTNRMPKDQSVRWEVAVPPQAGRFHYHARLIKTPETGPPYYLVVNRRGEVRHLTESVFWGWWQQKGGDYGTVRVFDPYNKYAGNPYSSSGYGGIDSEF